MQRLLKIAQNHGGKFGVEITLLLGLFDLSLLDFLLLVIQILRQCFLRIFDEFKVDIAEFDLHQVKVIH